MNDRPEWDSNPRITDLQSVPLVHLGIRPRLTDDIAGVCADQVSLCAHRGVTILYGEYRIEPLDVAAGEMVFSELPPDDPRGIAAVARFVPQIVMLGNAVAVGI